jgi:hypothetical protein
MAEKSGDKTVAQSQFTSVLCENVVRTIAPMFDNVKLGISAELTMHQATLNAILARLETLELSTSNSSGAVAKRAVRTGGSKAAVKVIGAPDDDWTKVRNSMLYSHKMWVSSPDYRYEFGGNGNDHEIQRVKSIFASDDNIKKKVGNETERLRAEAQCLWKNVLSKEQKTIIKDRYTQFDNDRKAGALQPPLTTEDPEADMGDII